MPAILPKSGKNVAAELTKIFSSFEQRPVVPKWYNTGMGKTNTKHVVIALRMMSIAGLDKLGGIFEYLSDGPRWSLSIYRSQQEFTSETVKREIARGADAFIIGIPGVDEALETLAKTEIPVVIMNVDPGALAKRRCGYVFIRSDPESVGREAAHALLSQGVYRSYGYVGYREDDEWSQNRGKHFGDTLAMAGFSCATFNEPHIHEKIADRLTLVRWLRNLPKPCGLLAACDDTAFEIVDACREAGLRIPQEIGVLGVNNDPLLCENADPKISSVQPNFRLEGYLAAKALHRPTRENRFCVGIRQIVHRESTYPISPSGKLVQRALAYIEKNRLKKLTVAAVAAHLHVSRSLLDLRFRELQSTTVREAIVTARVNEVKHRLLTTHDPLGKIASDCGWTNENALKNLFRKETGKAMSAWRNHERHAADRAP